MNIILVTALIKQNLKDRLTPGASVHSAICSHLIRHDLKICDIETDSFNLIHHC